MKRAALKIIKKLIEARGFDIQLKKINDKHSRDDLYNYLKKYGETAMQNRLFHNVGSTDFNHPAWTTIDHSSEWYSKIQKDHVHLEWDLMTLTPMPVNDESSYIIYSSQMIEHVSNSAVQNFLSESYRVLKNGGTCRVSTPNAELCYQAMLLNDRDFFEWSELPKYNDPGSKFLNKKLSEATIEEIFLFYFIGNASALCKYGKHNVSNEEFLHLLSSVPYETALDQCAAKVCLETQKKFPGLHMNWFNEIKLRKMFENAGFSKDKIFLSGPGQSLTPVLRNGYWFDKSRSYLSLYMEAHKD